MNITKKNLLMLKKMTKEERIKKSVETGDFFYALDPDECLKFFFNK